MAFRYMGTKRHLAPHVRAALLDVADGRPVLDLFCGMGSVAEALASDVPVIVNDFLRFTSVFSRARFLNAKRTDTGTAMRRLIPPYLEHRERLRKGFVRRLADEARHMGAGPEGLADWMRRAPHAGRSAHYRQAAAVADRANGADRYQMITRYYSAGYFSTAQAIDLDAIRWAIDCRPSVGSRSWLLAAWLQAASAIINAPGHSAQFLKPNDRAAYVRIDRYWRRSAWEAFVTALAAIQPVGTTSWRSTNRVRNSEALNLLARLDQTDVGAVYADPPYTRDQYSRFYHLFESMYRYDFPTSKGEGRTPTPASMRSSSFSQANSVRDAFESLFVGVAQLGCPLVLSYPSNGLLVTRGADPIDVARPWLRVIDHLTVEHVHSTLGASKGDKSKRAEENLYVLRAS